MCSPGNRERNPAETTANVLGRHAGLPLQANDERQQVQSHEVRLKLRLSECNANESSFNRTKCG